MVLDLLGTRTFLPVLSAQLTKASQQPIPLDPVILQSILLVLAIGHRKNLILRAVNTEEVGIIARIVEWTLSTVFGLSTHRVKIRPSKSKAEGDGLSNPTAFLQSLFLPPAQIDASSTVPHHQGSNHSSTKQLTAHDKACTDPFADGLLAPSFSSHSHRHSHKRHSRSSYRHGHQRPNSRSKQNSSAVATATSHIPSALIIIGLEHASDASQRALVRVLANTRVPLAKSPGSEAYDHQDGDSEEEYRALPEDFIMVYVTSWEARERPAIHKSLLDKFAMSTNVIVQPKTKQALRSLSVASSIGTVTQNPFASRPNSPHPHSYSMQSTPHSVSSPLPSQSSIRPQTQTPQQKSIPLSMPSASTSSATTNMLPATLWRTMPTPAPSFPALPSDFLTCLRHNTTHRTYISPTLTIYLQDLFTAARFDSPEFDATLLTAKAMEDAEMLVRACRVLGTEMGGWELIRGGAGEATEGNQESKMEGDGDEDGSSTNGFLWEFENGYDPSGGIAIDLGIEDTSSEGRLANTRKHRWEKEKNVERRPVRVAFDEVQIISPSIGTTRDAPLDTTMFDVSEADVARVVPRVISHRVKMRESWTDEVLAGVVYGAAFPVETERGNTGHPTGRDEEVEDEDLSVRDMLVRILQRV